jgi:hypothetical protein
VISLSIESVLCSLHGRTSAKLQLIDDSKLRGGGNKKTAIPTKGYHGFEAKFTWSRSLMLSCFFEKEKIALLYIG